MIAVQRNKYGARRVTLDGYTFDSQAEARRYGELKLLLAAGTIQALTVHPVFPLVVRDVKCGRYVADFDYLEKRHDGSWAHVVEDVKGVRTPVYRLKAKLLFALYGHRVREVTA